MNLLAFAALPHDEHADRSSVLPSQSLSTLSHVVSSLWYWGDAASKSAAPHTQPSAPMHLPTLPAHAPFWLEQGCADSPSSMLPSQSSSLPLQVSVGATPHPPHSLGVQHTPSPHALL